MARIIRGQVIAGTNLDRLGERISREELFNLFQQLSATTPAGVDHDLSQVPVTRLLNKRLEERENGELTIVVDLEVLDEDAFSRMGGFSISFTRETVRFGSGDRPDLAVLVNPAQIDFRSVVESVRSIARPGVTVDATELVQKAEIITIAVITVIVWAASATGAGFFSAAGEALFEKLRSLTRRDDPEKPVSIQLHVVVATPSHDTVTIVLTIPASVSERVVAHLDVIELSRIVEAISPESRVARVLGSVSDNGEVRLERALSLAGNVIDLQLHGEETAARFRPSKVSLARRKPRAPRR